MKFKVGDKVRMVGSNRWHGEARDWIGKIGVIIWIHEFSTYPYGISLENGKGVIWFKAGIRPLDPQLLLFEI